MSDKKKEYSQDVAGGHLFLRVKTNLAFRDEDCYHGLKS